jgi:hypothetical protein
MKVRRNKLTLGVIGKASAKPSRLCVYSLLIAASMHFTPTFRKKRKYMAFTDGALRSMTPGQELMSFVEVKKRMTQKRQDEILMQEGGEMVGWIKREQSKLPTAPVTESCVIGCSRQTR